MTQCTEERNNSGLHCPMIAKLTVLLRILNCQQSQKI